MTISAQSIIRRAIDVLQDKTSVRWDVNELIRWLNDAQRIIVRVRPDSSITRHTLFLIGGARQSLASPGADAGVNPLNPRPVKLIEVTHNMVGNEPGRAVRLIKREYLDALIPDWHASARSSVIAHYMYDPRDPLTFYVYPPSADDTELEVKYSAYPVDIDELLDMPAEGDPYTGVAGDIGLPDIYADDILNLILYRAFSKDSEFANNAEKAASYLTAAVQSLGAEVAATVQVAPQEK